MQFLLAVTTKFGEAYLKNIMLPVFLVAVGDDADLKNLPSNSQPKIRGNDFCNICFSEVVDTYLCFSEVVDTLVV